MAQQFNGLWKQTSMEGDVTMFLTALGVGMAGRQMAWAAGYGNGGDAVGLLLHERVLYCEEFTGGSCFHSILKLDSTPAKQVECEASSLVDVRTVWMTVKLTQDGKLEYDRYLDADGQQLWAKVARTVSEDGRYMSTKAVFHLLDGSVANIDVAHEKFTFPRFTPDHPNLDYVQSWSPVLITEQMSPSKPGLKSAVTESLEGIFPSDAELFESLVAAFRNHTLKAHEESCEKEDISDTEFVKTITTKDGMQYSIRAKCDVDARRCEASVNLNSIVNVFGSFTMTKIIQVHKQPLCVEAWFQTSADDDDTRFLKSKHANACTILEELTGGAYRHFSSQVSKGGA